MQKVFELQALEEVHLPKWRGPESGPLHLGKCTYFYDL